MQEIVRGSTVQNAMSWLGGFSPSNRFASLFGIGTTAVNPAFAALPIAGTMAKGAAESAATRRTEQLGALIRAGEAPARQPVQGVAGPMVRGAAMGTNSD